MKRYLLRGFETENAAKERSREIALEQGVAPDAQTQYWFRWVQLSKDEWALLVDEGTEGSLSEEERLSNRFVEVPQQRTWEIMPSVVYRYMKQVYIDEFFKSGKIRLSSFSLFSKHDDEQRKDTSEGQNILTGVGRRQTLSAMTVHGHNAYILSASYLKSETLMRDFESDGCFKITNSNGFGIAIANKIPGCRRGVEGPCQYKSRRVITRDIGDFHVDDLRREDDATIDGDKMMRRVLEIGGSDVFFVKLGKYQHQLEYRFVWGIDQKSDDYIFIECPEALRFCERVE